LEATAGSGEVTAALEAAAFAAPEVEGRAAFAAAAVAAFAAAATAAAAAASFSFASAASFASALTLRASASDFSSGVDSSAETVQSRYSWMVAALASVARFVPGRGGGACPASNARKRKGRSCRAQRIPSLRSSFVFFRVCVCVVETARERWLTPGGGGRGQKSERMSGREKEREREK